MEADSTVLYYNTQTIRIIEPGYYSVRVRDSTGCFSNYSEAYFFESRDQKEALLSNVLVFPNPTSGLFQLNISGLEDDISIQVVNLAGKTLTRRIPF
jgi:hypothetical protein